MSPKVWFSVGVVLLLMLVAGPPKAHAQTRWLQTVEMITPLQDDYVTRALLDSLVAALMYEDLPVKRSPEDTQPMSFVTLEDGLLNEGLDFTSATHLFVGYRLEANQRRFVSDITHLFFIYRPEEAGGIDEPILYLNGDSPIVQRVLERSGTPLPNNEAAVLPFMQQMTFHKLPESVVVKVGGDIIRDENEAAEEKKRLLATIRRFMFN